MDRNVDTVAPNPLPNKDRRIKPIDEEQLAHTVESMLKDEPDSNEVVAVAVSIFVSSLFKGVMVSTPNATTTTFRSHSHLSFGFDFSLSKSPIQQYLRRMFHLVFAYTKQFETNFFGLMGFTKKVLPLMMIQRDGGVGVGGR